MRTANQEFIQVKHAIKSKKSDNFIWRKSTTILVFSLCEYVVIMSNLGYHATSYYDYHHVSINLSSLLWSRAKSFHRRQPKM